jgi:hypothetical protein
MSKPIGTKQATKEHRTRKNPKAAEDFAAKRHANNAKRRPQKWGWLNDEQTIGRWVR